MNDPISPMRKHVPIHPHTQHSSFIRKSTVEVVNSISFVGFTDAAAHSPTIDDKMGGIRGMRKLPPFSGLIALAVFWGVRYPPLSPY
jgi:hypothetical protein